MLHKFFEPGAWFMPKRYGYGSGLPTAWQGWVVLLSYIAVMTGLALLAPAGVTETIVAVVLMVLATAALVTIVHRRTPGGWRWRWGDSD
jgi:hypothetical protein